MFRPWSVTNLNVGAMSTLTGGLASIVAAGLVYSVLIFMGKCRFEKTL